MDFIDEIAEQLRPRTYKGGEKCLNCKVNEPMYWNGEATPYCEECSNELEAIACAELSARA